MVLIEYTVTTQTHYQTAIQAISLPVYINTTLAVTECSVWSSLLFQSVIHCISVVFKELKIFITTQYTHIIYHWKAKACTLC